MGNEIEKENYFLVLNNVDCSNKIKEKNHLKYLSWASAWTEVKKKFPDAYYEIIPQIVDDKHNERPWHDDTRTAWVMVRVTIGNNSVEEMLPIMDLRNKPISADEVTSVDANKAIKRCLTKACAEHGLAMYIYEGEDIPEELSKIQSLQDECVALMKKRASLSEDAKQEVARLCKEADAEYTGFSVDEVVGNPATINDSAILEKLKMQLRKVRK